MIAGLLVAAAVCAGANDAAADPVRMARADFNRAIAAGDLETVRSILAGNAFLISGTDSIQFSGREAQVDLWREDFAKDDRLLYVRSPDCVTLSDLYPIAMETGDWRGAPAANEENFVGGRYAAKWREVDGRWLIESETYLTTRCGGALCPAAAGTKP